MLKSDILPYRQKLIYLPILFLKLSLSSYKIMSKSKKPQKRQQQYRKPIKKQPAKKSTEGEKSAPNTQKTRKERLKDKLPVLKFFAIFAALVGLYYLGIATEATASILESYTKFTAKLSAVVLSILGEQAAANGYMLSSPRYMLMVGVGCEGSEPIALFLSAVIAFPMAWKYKIWGILGGVVTLFLLNLFRIIGLYYSGIYARSIFEMLHSEVFPIIFIIIAMVLWLIWLNWASNKTKPEAA